MEQPKPEAQAVADLVKDLHQPEVVDLDHGDLKGQVLVTPRGVNVQSAKPFFDEWRGAPERREGTATLVTIDSFIAHANRFKDADSALFADPGDSPKLVAVLDYHRPGPDGAPRFGRHRSVYEFPISEEWEAWTTKDGQMMPQAAFAEFIEERIQDIGAPAAAEAPVKDFATKIGCQLATPAQLLTLSKGLSVRANSRVVNAQNLSTGEGELIYEQTHTDDKGKPLSVPGAFMLVIPVFQGDALYQVPVRLRYRVREAQVTWAVALYRPERFFDDAFKLACEKANKATSLPLFMGQPE